MPSDHHDEIEAIDQQFDEVLKFLAESINGEKFKSSSQSSPEASSVSSPSFNSDQFIDSKNELAKKHEDGLSGSGSNSSGIGEDFYIGIGIEKHIRSIGTSVFGAPSVY